MPGPITLSDYLSLFSPAVRGKPRFMALAGAVLSQAADLLRLAREDYPAAFDLESAAGAQLDALGGLADVPRPLPSTPDEDYRFLLRARIAAHHWDGTNETLPAVLAAAFPGREARLIDNQDGTVTASLSGDVPFPLSELFPCPAGIRLISGS